MNNIDRALQLRRALQLFAQTITDESSMMEIATIYPEYKVGVSYKTGDVFSHGLNADGETQLYQALQDHTSVAEWTPDTASSLYKQVGVTEDGTAIWTQPLGATDAYMAGDIVVHNSEIWQSDVDNNVWEPGVYGWTMVQGRHPHKLYIQKEALP